MTKIDIMAPAPTSRGAGAEAQGGLTPALAKKNYQLDLISIAQGRYYINEKNYLTKLCKCLYDSGWYLKNKSIWYMLEA